MASSVDELKALANTKLGFARANRFLVTMPTSFGGGGGLLGGIIGMDIISYKTNIIHIFENVFHHRMITYQGAY